MTEIDGGIIDLESRYGEFQSEAVANILNDYREKPDGRFLLVIPTGGGKTYTGVTAVNRLFHEGVFDSESETVVWGAHRQELVIQAKDTLQAYSQKKPEEAYIDRIHVMGMAKVNSYVAAHKSVKLVVIDEAHHAAIENVQYGPLFDYPHLGILGLTATPSRHDGKPLEFEKETYSIGFPDLVEKQIILAPAIRTIETKKKFHAITARGSGFAGLNQLDTKERNEQIIKHIIDNHDDYSKIIVYTGSVEHTRNLCKQMSTSPLSQLYESIDYILGTQHSGGGERDEFVKRLKSYDRSIVVNHDVLSEGYDDPQVNTVVMVRPSRSKLVYMQAIGRAIRIEPGDPSKKAFIVEVVDDLPNIRYRIDNRWLFSEVSDILEPAVTDRFFGSAAEFEQRLTEIYFEYDVEEKDRAFPEWKKSVRYSLLLFRCYIGDDKFKHIPVLIDSGNRSQVSNWFNFLSERLDQYSRIGVNPDQAMQMARYEGIGALQDATCRHLIYDAMEEASRAVTSGVSSDEADRPWITYVALRFRQRDLSSELAEFIGELVNREQIELQVRERNFGAGSFLVRFPLPLSSYFGQIITEAEFNKLDAIVEQLKHIKETQVGIDHRRTVRDCLDQSVLPVDMIYRDALSTIVRENDSYFLRLE